MAYPKVTCWEIDRNVGSVVPTSRLMLGESVEINKKHGPENDLVEDEIEVLRLFEMYGSERPLKLQLQAPENGIQSN